MEPRREPYRGLTRVGESIARNDLQIERPVRTQESSFGGRGTSFGVPERGEPGGCLSQPSVWWKELLYASYRLCHPWLETM